MSKSKDGYNMNIRISKDLRMRLLQWGVNHGGKPYSVLVRKLLEGYFAGKVAVEL